jgi:hypothetical protein
MVNPSHTTSLEGFSLAHKTLRSEIKEDFPKLESLRKGELKMISSIIARCIFCGKEADVELFTPVGMAFIHDQCAQDLERMISETDEEPDEPEEKTAITVIRKD